MVAPIDAPATSPVPRLGFIAGEIEVPHDFDTMGREEIERLFGLRP